MTKQVETEPEGIKNLPHLFLITALLVLPGAIWEVIGWISFFIPLTVFVFIIRYGWSYTGRHFTIAIIIATVVSFFLQSLELTLFSAALVPTGFVIARSALQQEEPWLAGFKGACVLAVSLVIFFGILLANSDVSFFTALTETFNSAIDEALKQERQRDNITSESYEFLEKSLFQMKVIAPKIFFGILASLIVSVAWITVALGNTLLQRIGEKQPWPQYRHWRLPDRLIWMLIVSGVLTVMPGETSRIIGINGLIISALLYSFQGLAILVFFVNKWNIPRILRPVIYILMVLQSLGTIILLGLGVADVWLDIRRHRFTQDDDTKEAD